MAELPKGFTNVGGRAFDELGNWVELFDGKWTPVRNGERAGWWRYHDHYDRNGYCDNPARGY